MALDNYKLYGDFKNVMSIYNLIGNCYTLDNKLDSAQFYYEQCIDLLESVDNFLYKSSVLNNLSVGYRVLGDTLRAKEFLYEALTYPISSKEKSRITHNLAKINFHEKDSFYFYMDKSFEFLQEEEDIDLKRILYQLYSRFEEEQRMYDLALDHYKNYVHYLQEVHKKDYEESLNLLQHKFYLKGFEQENMRLLIRSQRLFIVGFIVIILLLLAVVYIFRQNKLLGDAEKNVEYLMKMSELYNEKEKNLKNIVLQNFNIMKKVAGLEQYMVTNPSSSKLLKKFNEIVYNQDSMNWEQLYETMNSLHNNLFAKLKRDFSELDESEFRICCLTIGKFSNMEMGIIMKYSPHTIQSKKAAIRKKLGVKPMGNIGDFLYNYYENKSHDI
ncbi:MAG: transcriptional regulator [Bacteroides sp.]|nr:transcriptional regulator [Bacteroides sp.]